MRTARGGHTRQAVQERRPPRQVVVVVGVVGVGEEVGVPTTSAEGAQVRQVVGR